MVAARRRSGARRRFDSDERRAVPLAMVGIGRAILGPLLALSCAAPALQRSSVSVTPGSAVPVSVPVAADPRAVEEAALRRLAVAGLERLRPCYGRELGLDPALESKMAIQLFVTTDGKVADMHLLDAETEDPKLPPTATLLSDAMARCLGVEVMTWTFPPTTWIGQVVLFQPPLFVASFSTKPIDPTKTDQGFADQKEKIRQVIRGGNLAYKACYESYLDRGGPTNQPTRIKARIRIQNDGAVAHASVFDATTVEPRLADCLIGALQKLAFGKLRGDGIMIVEYPLLFEPAH